MFCASSRGITGRGCKCTLPSGQGSSSDPPASLAPTKQANCTQASLPSLHLPCLLSVAFRRPAHFQREPSPPLPPVQSPVPQRPAAALGSPTGPGLALCRPTREKGNHSSPKWSVKLCQGKRKTRNAGEKEDKFSPILRLKSSRTSVPRPQQKHTCKRNQRNRWISQGSVHQAPSSFASLCPVTSLPAIKLSPRTASSVYWQSRCDLCVLNVTNRSALCKGLPASQQTCNYEGEPTNGHLCGHWKDDEICPRTGNT